jgi:tetratricopeptide (TPR) repeat protein
LDIINEALKSYPGNPNFWLAKGVVLTKMARYNEAVIAYDKALEIKPDLASARQGKEKAIQSLGNQKNITK